MMSDYGRLSIEWCDVCDKWKNNMELVLHGWIPSKKNSCITLPNGRTVPSINYSRWQYKARKFVRDTWLRTPIIEPITIQIETNCHNDTDDLANTVLDILEGIVYESSQQVREIMVEKRKKKHGEDYETVIRVEGLD